MFGDGQNSIPLIHIRDLARSVAMDTHVYCHYVHVISIIVNIADIRPKIKFIVAVDESNCTLEDIVQVRGVALYSGRVPYNWVCPFC